MAALAHQVVSVPDPARPRPTAPPDLRNGYLVTGMEVIRRGLCPACAARHRPSPD